jgi:Methyltransferase domain
VRWQYKYAAQKALSLLPLRAGIRVNDALSDGLGRRRTPRFWAFASALVMLALLERQHGSAEGKQCIELGTGWEGAAPLLLLSMGATSVHSFDRCRLLRRELLLEARQRLQDLKPFTDVFPAFQADAAAIAARLRPESVDLSRFFYHAPSDFRASGLASGSADLFYSLAVLHSVEERHLLPIHQEALRVLRPGGLAIHYVPLTMEAAETDSRATGIEFLGVSDRTWNLFYRNTLAHENRLRAAEHCELIERAGFRILSKHCSISQKCLERLKSMSVAPRFQRFTPEELAVDMLWIVAQKGG